MRHGAERRAVSMAKSENLDCPPRRPVRAGRHASGALGVIPRVRSPRATRQRDWVRSSQKRVKPHTEPWQHRRMTLQDDLTHRADEVDFSGTVLVLRNGERIATIARGAANRAEGLANAIRTRDWTTAWARRWSGYVPSRPRSRTLPRVACG